MKKNLFSKALALCLAVVLCLGMLAGCGGKQLTPKELFDLTVNNEEKEINDGVITMYGSSLDAMTAAEGTTVGVKISLGDAARQLLGTATQGQVSFDWLKEIGLSFGSKLDKGVSSNQVGISLNGTELAKVNAVLDTQNEKAFFSVPELLSDALSLDIKAMMEKTGASLPVDLKSVMDLKSWLPDQAVLKSLTDKYTKLVLSNITDIVKEDATVDAGGLSQKCSKLTTTIGADTAKKIASAVADAAEMAATGVSAIMVGRSALRDPAIFARLRGQDPDSSATSQTLSPYETAMRHLGYIIEFRQMLASKFPEDHILDEDMFVALKARTHLFRYFSGVPGAAALRKRFNAVRTRAELMDVLATTAG